MRISFAEQNHKTVNTKNRRWKGLSSTVAIAAALSASPLHAQLATDDETVETEVVAISGQQFDGLTLGGFLPVVVGGEGDLLFLSRTANDSFITYDNALGRVTNAPAFGLQSVLNGRYSIDAAGDQFAITTTSGVVVGSVSDNIGRALPISDSLDGAPIVGQGNLGVGASPLILGGQTALLLSNVDEANSNDFRDFVLFAEVGEDIFETEFRHIEGFSSFYSDRAQTSNITDVSSLSFAGPGRLFGSVSAIATASNSAQTSNLVRFGFDDLGLSGTFQQIGPDGDPQPNGNGLSGGDVAFAGFTFFDNSGVNAVNTGANFDSSQFSANSESAVFVLGNAGLSLTGGPGQDVPGEVLVFNDQVILTARRSGGLTTQTSVGALDILGFQNVTLADNGDILFSTRPFFRPGGNPARELANSVGLWRIINPGQPDQAVVPVVREGDSLIISQSGLDTLFPNGTMDTTATIAGFDFATIGAAQGGTSDGRSNVVSVNAQGHVATVAQIRTGDGISDAIIAQDDNGDFHVVAFLGQVIDVDGQGDLRRITGFTGQFGSNDVDGAGDLFNSNEQLGFLVELDRLSTTQSESDQAVLRVSLNGIMQAPITNFLFQGDCGDNFFGSQCTVNGRDGSNFVNADDTSQVADFVPGTNGEPATVTVIGNDLRVDGIDVTLVMINSDSGLTIENGANFEVTNGGTIGDLTVDANSFTNGGDLSLDSLTTTDGAEFNNTGNVEVDGSAIIRGDIFGDGSLSAVDFTFESNSAEEINVENRIEAGNLNISNNVIFGQDVSVGGNFTATGIRISGTGKITVEADIGDPRPVVNFGGNASGRMTLGNDFELVTADFNQARGAFLDIEGTGSLTLSAGSVGTLDDSNIIGSGRLIVQDESRLVTMRSVTINPDIEFFDADRDVNDALPTLDIQGDGLNVGNILFSRTDNQAPDQTTSSRIRTQFAQTSLTIDQDNSLSVFDDFVVLEGAGSLDLAGTLNTTDRGIFENRATVNLQGLAQDRFGNQTSNGQIIGDGLFRNRGIVEGFGTFDTLVDSGLGGVVNITGNTTFNVDAARARDNEVVFLFDNATENLDLEGDFTVDGTEIAAVIGDVNVDSGSIVTVEGDGAVFFNGNIKLGDAQPADPDFPSAFLEIQSHAFLAETAMIESDSILQIGRDVIAPVDVAILDSTAEDDFFVSGEGTANIVNASLIGISQAVNDVEMGPDGPIFNGAVLRFSLQNDAVENLRTTRPDLNPEFNPGDFFNVNNDLADIDRIAEVTALQFTINDTTIENLTLRNTGVAQAGTVIFRDANIFNQGWLQITDTIFQEESGALINALGGRLQVETAVEIDAIVENQGLFVVAPNSGAVNVRTLNQAPVSSDSQTAGSAFFNRLADSPGLSVGANATLTVGMSSLLGEGDVRNSGGFLSVANSLNGLLRVEGTLNLQRSGDRPNIFNIRSDADIAIMGDGRINNIDANASDLAIIAGRFITDGIYDGDFLSVVAEGDASFRSIRGDEILVTRDARLEARSFDETLRTEIDSLIVEGTFESSNRNNVFNSLRVSAGGIFIGSGRTDIDAQQIVVDGIIGANRPGNGGSFFVDDIGIINTGSLTINQGGEVNAREININNDLRNDGTLQITENAGFNGDFTNDGDFTLGSEDGMVMANLQANNVFNSGNWGGSGNIDGNFTQTTNGSGLLPSLSPGFSPGIINIAGDATFNDGVVLFEVGGLTPGTEHDQINVGGNLTIGTNAMIVVDLLEQPDGSLFLPQTGDEIVIFTAADINPDDVEQINFSVVDTLPRGFTLVPDITQNANGEIFRVLRGFDGSTLTALVGLDPAQSAVAGAIDFLSSSDSGVPSDALFQLAVDLQFNEDSAEQLDTLVALGGTTISAVQGNALRAGSYGLNFAKSRLERSDDLPSLQPVARSAGSPQLASLAVSSASRTALNSDAMAAAVSQQLEQSGGRSYKGRDGSTIGIFGSASYHKSDQDSRLGTVGFDSDGWSAHLGAEYESADGTFVIGAAGSLGDSEANLDANRGSVETDSTAISVYTQYRGNGFALSGGYSIADLDIESQRRVLGVSANGQTDGEVQHLFGRANIDLIDSAKWKVGPEATITHSDLDIDGFAETGAGALNLAIPSLDRKATTLDLLATAQRRFDAGDWFGNIRVKAGYQWALSGDQFTTAPLSFGVAPATSFANPLRPLVNDGVSLSTAISMHNKSGVGLSVGYDGFFGKRGQDYHDLSFRVSIAF